MSKHASYLLILLLLLLGSASKTINNVSKENYANYNLAEYVSVLDTNGNKIVDYVERKFQNQQVDRINLIVLLNSILSNEEVSLLTNEGIQVKKIYGTLINALVISNVTRIGLLKIKKIIGRKIIVIEEDNKRRLLMDRALNNTGIRPFVWKNIAINTSVFTTVAIIDTGIDTSHMDLKGKLVYWRDLTGESESPFDPIGHGTMIASIIAGEGLGTENGSIWITYTGNIYTHSKVVFTLDVPKDQTITLNASFIIPKNNYTKMLKMNLTFVNENESWKQTVIFDTNKSLQLYLKKGIYYAYGCSDQYDISYVFRLKVDRRIDEFPPMRGVNPNLKLAVFKIFRTGEITTSDALILEALNKISELVKKLNIVAINLSLGGYMPSISIDYAINQLAKEGVSTIAAAGNSYIDLYKVGVTERQIGSPGTAAYAITVGGTNDYRGIAIYSSRGGSYTDGLDIPYTKPDILAPSGGLIKGSWIVAADANCKDGIFLDYPNDYTGAIGTSFATPIITGLVATCISAMISQGEWYWNLSSVMFLKFLILLSTYETTYIGVHETEFQYKNITVSRLAPSFDFGRKDPDEGFGFISAPAFFLLLENIYNKPNASIELSISANELMGSLIHGFILKMDGCYSVEISYEGDLDYYLAIYKAYSNDGSPIYVDYLYSQKNSLIIRGKGIYAFMIKPHSIYDTDGTIRIRIVKRQGLSPYTYAYVLILALLLFCVAIATFLRRSQK